MTPRRPHKPLRELYSGSRGPAAKIVMVHARTSEVDALLFANAAHGAGLTVSAALRAAMSQWLKGKS